MSKPELLAPAGDLPSFLAALAAGADAVYLGLKHFTARMQAENFSLTELARMVELAHAEGRRVYVAMNSLLKPGDIDAALRLIARLERDVHPDALIMQDLGMPELARQAGFRGELHFSTLSNVTHPAALRAAYAAGASRVILPRELSLDEIRMTAQQCPEGLSLESFVHGALCWCVSGRCYWSSFLGGKSGLRGRCVQPCRRIYSQGSESGKKGHSGRWFSCLDLSLDVLAKTLLGIPHLAGWKIEGRKKGPHYVYHVVSAYRLLRDNPDDAQAKKAAMDILDMALGRPPTHARFLPQRQHAPTAPDGLTSSGLLAGKVAINEQGKPVLKARLDLLPKDYLRVGVEDERWHATLSVPRRIPKAGTFVLKLAKHKTPKAGTPVFLIDRREPELADVLRQWERRLAQYKGAGTGAVDISPRLPTPAKARRLPDMLLRATLPRGKETRGGKSIMALWLSPGTVRGISRTVAARVSWWLPPVIWPDEEEQVLRQVREAMKNGGRHFVCNAPWQNALFAQERVPADIRLIAGPFCNAANAAALTALARMGFAGAFASPELCAEELLALPGQSCLPLGLVLSGHWPMGLARHKLMGAQNNEPFRSPKGEIFWIRPYGQNVWVYSGWPLDLTGKRQELEAAGYSFFAHMPEKPPRTLPEARRSSLFNWEGALL
ncbi:MAG: U32 family peptidase [Deltaproteobacteria bacterium]|nr:U32 family peptidase [Deltaproteobacteria bacterium]